MYLEVRREKQAFKYLQRVQFSPLTDWVVGGNMRDNSAESLFQSFLQMRLACQTLSNEVYEVVEKVALVL